MQKMKSSSERERENTLYSLFLGCSVFLFAFCVVGGYIWLAILGIGNLNPPPPATPVPSYSPTARPALTKAPSLVHGG